MATRHEVDVRVVNAADAHPLSDIGFSVTAVAGGTALPSQACSKVTLQNRLTADDGSTAQENSVWVEIGGVKVFELLNGVSVEVHVTDADEVTVRSFTGTSLVSGVICPTA